MDYVVGHLHSTPQWTAFVMDEAEISIEDELTPAQLRCGGGTCPAVYRLSDGTLLIVGKVINPSLLAQISDRIGPGEAAVIISPDYLAALV
jgi:hypothetical protein